MAPIWLNRHIAGLKRLSDETTVRAERLSSALRYALAEEVTSHQEYRASHAPVESPKPWALRFR
ncbi:MAG TPA: hypothetical protein VH277_02245 [Gemmatimonadaceae bacterium]|jgi:hypothetical protein|nr:hypothetical protein [Gemmatimonadaceae bacterium]